MYLLYIALDRIYFKSSFYLGSLLENKSSKVEENISQDH